MTCSFPLHRFELAHGHALAKLFVNESIGFDETQIMINKSVNPASRTLFIKSAKTWEVDTKIISNLIICIHAITG